jgi:hypothetical protein
MEFATGKLRCLNPAWTPFSGTAGPAGGRLQLIHDFGGAKLKALKTAWMPFLGQRTG